MTDPFGPPSAGPLFASGEYRSNGKGFDPAPGVQGTAALSQTITSTSAGATSLTFGSAAATALVFPGQQLILTPANEVVWVGSNWTPGSSNVVPLVSPVVNSGQTAANWSGYSAFGAGNTAFYGQGLPVTALAAFDGTSKYGLVRSGNADSLAVTQGLSAANLGFNGSTWDRLRSNIGASVLASTAQTTNYASAGQTNYNGAMLHVCFNVTAVSGTSPSAVFGIDAQDPVSLNWYNLVSSAAVTTTGLTVLKVGPGLPVTANVSVNDMVPRTWRATATITGTTPSFTMSIGANLNE